MGKSNTEFKASFTGALEQAQEDLANLAGEIRDSADSMEETFPGSERTERYAEAADTLEDIDLDLVVPEALGERQVTYTQDTRKGQPKRTRLRNLYDILDALHTAAESFEKELSGDDEADEDVVSDTEALTATLEEARDNVDAVEL